MIFRLIAAKWSGLEPDTFEGEFTLEEVLEWNKEGYNCYFFPNHPSDYSTLPDNPKTGRKRPVKASDIDVFNYCFVDLDMKDYQSTNADRRHEYATKQEFVDKVLSDGPKPTSVIDSGGGIHVYWKINDLDAMSYLRLNRRLCRKFKTDPAVSNVKQLMRVPGTVNVKNQEDFKLCEVLFDSDAAYSSEDLSKALPAISPGDEDYCREHYNRCFNITDENVKVTEELPARFLKFCKNNKEAHRLFYDEHKDRSSADYRLAHLLHGNGFSKEEARSVLFNTSKAAERTPIHRYNYSQNIVDKVWVDVAKEDKPRAATKLSRSVKDIMATLDEEDNSTRFPCHEMLDATENGFRLSQILGLVGGSGNGKTTTALNLFAWFTEYNINKNYIHLFVSLEQPEKEIAVRWARMSKKLKADKPNIDWDDTVHILGNYDADGAYRDLGLQEIQDYIIELEKETGKKVGCVVIDHIGVLRQEKSSDEFSGLIGVCKRMKSFAVSTNTFLVMQSQTSRAKNGGGDVELDMDAAYGTSNFEFYCDYVMTTWQPLKRVLANASHMTIMAFKMAKIRIKDVLKDRIKADSTYAMFFDPRTEVLRELTSDEFKALGFWIPKANQIRNKDRKREPGAIQIISWTKKGQEALAKEDEEPEQCQNPR